MPATPITPGSTTFQSSAAPKDGCDPRRRRTRSGNSNFNPQPPRRTAAILPCRGCRGAGNHFNPQPPRRTAAIPGRRPSPAAPRISILSRPEGRLRLLPGDLVFWHPRYFNPQPPRRTAAMGIVPRRHRSCSISILSRPEGRLRSSWTQASRHAPPFQSSAAPKDGCDAVCPWRVSSCLHFNPQPPRRTAAIGIAAIIVYTCSEFQSSAAPKDGCDAAGPCFRWGQSHFNPQPPRRTAAIRRTGGQ